MDGGTKSKSQIHCKTRMETQISFTSIYSSSHMMSSHEKSMMVAFKSCWKASSDFDLKTFLAHTFNYETVKLISLVFQLLLYKSSKPLKGKKWSIKIGISISNCINKNEVFWNQTNTNGRLVILESSGWKFGLGSILWYIGNKHQWDVGCPI